MKITLYIPSDIHLRHLLYFKNNFPKSYVELKKGETRYWEFRQCHSIINIKRRYEL